jgi:hypothetical protein
MNPQEIYCQAWWSFSMMWSWMSGEIREYPFLTLAVAALFLMFWRFLIPNPRTN